MNKLLLYLIAIIAIWALVINPLNHTSVGDNEHGGGGGQR